MRKEEKQGDSHNSSIVSHKSNIASSSVKKVLIFLKTLEYGTDKLSAMYHPQDLPGKS